MAGAFYVHLADAIKVNRARSKHYSSWTGGRSRLLSALLIGFEVASLPVAWWFDRGARRFQARGISIITDDFVDMTEIAPAETASVYRREARKAELRLVGDWLRELGWTVRNAGTDFAAMTGVARQCLRRIEDLERQTEVHHAMSKHFVESIGVATAHALGYRAQSDGETDAFARQFVLSQVAGLFACTGFDAMAQRIHRRFGLGIVVNDVPAIPFDAAYDALAPEDRLAP